MSTLINSRNVLETKIRVKIGVPLPLWPIRNRIPPAVFLFSSEQYASLVSVCVRNWRRRTVVNCFFSARLFFSITDYYVIPLYCPSIWSQYFAKEYRYTLVRTRDTRRSHWLIAFIEHTVPFYDFISPMLIPVYRCTFMNTIRIEYYNKNNCIDCRCEKKLFNDV